VIIEIFNRSNAIYFADGISIELSSIETFLREKFNISSETTIQFETVISGGDVKEHLVTLPKGKMLFLFGSINEQM
jgi:hypothetical protein